MKGGLTRPMDARDSASAWSPGTRALFRFGFVYLVLYNLPFPLDLIPWAGEIITQPYADLWNRLVPWFGKHLLGLNITVRPNGSGDTTYNYVQLLIYVILAAAAALVWTLLDRKRTEYGRLYEGLRIYVRLSLAVAMLAYGAYKIIPSQFGAPFPSQLLEPIGEASPMGLLWTFMGASSAYTMFTGAAEFLGGLLLVFRRTTVLGALVCIGVMSNVVLLNYSYDIPVKLFSSHLLAMAVFLLLPDLRRLLHLFVLNRPVEPAVIHPLGRKMLVAQALIVVVCGGYPLYRSWEGSKQFGNLAPKPPLYGIWAVDELEADGAARPPLLSDAKRWRRVVFDYPGYAVVQLMDGTRAYYGLTLGKRKLALESWDKESEKKRIHLAYQEIQPGVLTMEGALDGHASRLKLRRESESSYRLVSRGFHWINETPFNR
jgi:hypothetical protein